MLLFGHEVAHRAPHARARYGLARSFQDASLFAGLTVHRDCAGRNGAAGEAPAGVERWSGRPGSATGTEQPEAGLEIVEAFGLAPVATPHL